MVSLVQIQFPLLIKTPRYFLGVFIIFFSFSSVVIPLTPLLFLTFEHKSAPPPALTILNDHTKAEHTLAYALLLHY